VTTGATIVGATCQDLGYSAAWKLLGRALERLRPPSGRASRSQSGKETFSQSRRVRGVFALRVGELLHRQDRMPMKVSFHPDRFCVGQSPYARLTVAALCFATSSSNCFANEADALSASIRTASRVVVLIALSFPLWCRA